MPAKSCTSVVIVTVWFVEKDKLLSGVKVAVFPEESYVTEPFTVVAPVLSVKVDEFTTEAETIVSLNVVVIAVYMETSVAPLGTWTK